eukprot:NODE_4338_length_792_cov_68.571429_g4315_i0.p1 GENE.NODE_4338_length_792_cov_68.571429_g4315_i0~~NODE_4338_length_792_cov_68.571429_g4315_i0.p1  ORF type:complete len:152 (-),score=26.14 NODE_4338_length_792_cov_68.571429_g4315_i0:47-502(-)
MYYRGAAAALVVYDITSADSFERAKYWVKELNINSNGEIVIALTGNKCDLVDQRRVPQDEAKAYADEHGLVYVETSAKNSINVTEVFVEIARKLAKNITVAPSQQTSTQAVQLKQGPTEKPKKRLLQVTRAPPVSPVNRPQFRSSGLMLSL